MNGIGGYFQLELRVGDEYHTDAIRLNTGRNALELILITKQYSKVYIPFFTCDVVLEPFQKHQINYEFYSINNDFEPVFDFSKLDANEAFLYTNYFGLKDQFIIELAASCLNLLIDNTQSFFTKPILGVPTFYSCRKFFGVPDGSYLYLDKLFNVDFPVDHSECRFSHLINRIEYGASEGYADFRRNDTCLKGQKILKMSNITQALLRNIDYERVQKVRIANFLNLHSQLSELNQLNLSLDDGSVPMVYPFLTNRIELKQKLIDNKIYVASYWPNVLEWCQPSQLEYKMTSNIVFIPIDQRYGSAEIEFIVSCIND